MDNKALFQESELLFVIWKFRILKVLGNFVAAAIVLFAVPANADLLFTGDFEHGPIELTSENEDSPFYSNARDVSVVNSPIAPRSGDYYLRSYTQQSVWWYRSEVIPKVLKIAVGKEYWVGISIFIPADWKDDGLTLDAPLIFQFHDNSWSGLPKMQLPLNMNISQKGTTNWTIKQAGENGQGINYVYQESYLSDKGKWTDWVFNLRFSPGSDGFLKVWKNGTLVVNREGSNYASGHESHPANIQFGLYNWGYKDYYDASPHGTASRTIYHDELRVGDANSSFDEVSPVGETVQTVLGAPNNLRISISQSQ